LGAKLGDEQILHKLLADRDEWVAALAGLDAGLAGMTRLAGEIDTLLKKSIAEHRQVWGEYRKLTKPTLADREKLAAKIEIIACCAYALAELRAEGLFAKIRDLARQCDDPELQERLILAMVRMNTPADRDAVVRILREQRRPNGYPPAMAMEAAAELKIADPAVAEAAAKILQDAAKPIARLEQTQVIAALHLAEVLNLKDCGEFVADICEKLWSPGHPELLTPAIRLLGKFAAQMPPADPKRGKYLQLLRDASQYTAPDKGNKAAWQSAAGTTPLASATAGVALWLVEPAMQEFSVHRKNTGPGLGTPGLIEADMLKTSLFYLRQALAVDQADPADYAAWRLAMERPGLAFALGKVFLPDDAPGQKLREYNPQVRSAGATMLAMSAFSPQQKTEAAGRIFRRWPRLGFFERGDRLCAMLMLGHREYLPDVRELLAMEEFPLRRAMTALLVAGDKTALDRTLWNVNFPLPRLRELLIEQSTNQVLARTAGELPRPSPSASIDTQLWQMRLMRQFFGIAGAKVQLGLGRIRSVFPKDWPASGPCRALPGRR
jgi:hypothetical protein